MAFESVVHSVSHIITTLKKLLLCCVLRPTQPPNLSGTESQDSWDQNSVWTTSWPCFCETQEKLCVNQRKTRLHNTSQNSS